MQNPRSLRRYLLLGLSCMMFTALGIFIFYVLVDLFLPCSSSLWLRYLSLAYGLNLSKFWTNLDHACYSIAGPLGLISYRDPNANVGLHAEISFAIFASSFFLAEIVRSKNLSASLIDTLLVSSANVFVFELLLHLFAPYQTVCGTGVCVGTPTWTMTLTIDLYMRGLSWITNGLVFVVSLGATAILLAIKLRYNLTRSKRSFSSFAPPVRAEKRKE